MSTYSFLPTVDMYSSATQPKLIGNNTPVLKKGDSEPPLAPGRARLYSARFSPWAERVLLYAAAKGIEVEIVNIDLFNKPEWYASKHRQGKVPAFEKDGKIVIESSVIPEYLDALYPASAILPADPFDRAQQRVLVEQAAPLSSTFMGLFPVFGGKVQGEAREAKIKAVLDGLDVVEKLLKEEYFGGSAPGYADWMIFPQVERVALFSPSLSLCFPSSKWPALSAWWARISAHPAAAAAMQPTAVHLEAIRGLMSGKPNSDIGL